MHTFNAEDAIIALFERSTYADIGMAVIDKSKDKSKTSINGYLIQNVEKAPKWHYYSTDIAGKPYSIYYGKLNDRQHNGKVIADFISAGVKKEATLIEASSNTIWCVIFNERVESNEINVNLKDS